MAMAPLVEKSINGGCNVVSSKGNQGNYLVELNYGVYERTMFLMMSYYSVE